MLDNHLSESYRVLLTNRRGDKFSEQEVYVLLEQILPQLAEIHVQGGIHSNISLGTLKSNPNGKVSLVHSTGSSSELGCIAPEVMQTGQPTQAGDIYALGATLITLLTNVNPEVLRSPLCNWQDNCVVSDQLAQLLNRAIEPDVQSRFFDAVQMLQYFNSGYLPRPLYTAPSRSTQLLQGGQAKVNWKWMLIGVGASSLLGLTGFVGFKLQQPNSSTQTSQPSAPADSLPSPATPSLPVEDLATDAGIDYQRLSNLLKAQQFKEADLETTRLLLLITGREQQNSIDAASLNRFPCKDLSTIDRLWRQNSDDRFGFSIQNQIWQQVGKDATKFADQVGWLGQINLKDYQDLNFSISAQMGHLPIADYGPLYLSGIKKFNPALESKISACGIS
jgi:serine/threonine protein kinase